MWNAHSGMPRCRHAFPVAQTLVCNVVDGQDRRHPRALPAQIGRRETARPVVDVQHIGLPVHAGATGGDLGGGERQAREAQIVVGPVMALGAGIRASGALIERRLEHQIQDQAIVGSRLADAAGLDAGPAWQMRHHGDVARLGDHLRIGRQQHAHIDVAAAQRARQARRHLAQSTSLGEVGEFAGCEQNFHVSPAADGTVHCGWFG